MQRKTMNKIIDKLIKILMRLKRVEDPSLEVVHDMLSQQHTDLTELITYMTYVEDLCVPSPPGTIFNDRPNWKLSANEKLFLERYEFNLSCFRDEIKIRLNNRKDKTWIRKFLTKK